MYCSGRAGLWCSKQAPLKSQWLKTQKVYSSFSFHGHYEQAGTLLHAWAVRARAIPGSTGPRARCRKCPVDHHCFLELLSTHIPPLWELLWPQSDTRPLLSSMGQERQSVVCLEREPEICRFPNCVTSEGWGRNDGAVWFNGLEARGQGFSLIRSYP